MQLQLLLVLCFDWNMLLLLLLLLLQLLLFPASQHNFKTVCKWPPHLTLASSPK
jgi:hypothetical protein